MADIFDKIASDFSHERSSFLTQPLRMRRDYGESRTSSSSFQDMDADNDGRLSPEEWDEAFNQIDTDDSGFISEDEWDNPYFKELDADEDGVISEKEWGDGFNILDADEDGFISENEFYRRTAAEEEFIEDLSEEIVDLIEEEVDKEEQVNSRFVRQAGGHRGGSYMSLQNIRQMDDFLRTLEDQVHDGEELEDWVEDKISRAHAILSDLHRYFLFGDGYHTHED
tara:strand:- start:2858 stop:3532 length:675 start_codon:yes stop_codon:yes gene_type:complete